MTYAFGGRSDEAAHVIPLLILAFVVSVAVHVAIIWALAGCTFSGIDTSALRKDVRKWSRDVPVMQARHMVGDPLAVEENARGRPAVAPVVERERDRVERLVKVEMGTDAPHAVLQRQTSVPKAVQAVPKVEIPKIMPREDILRIENPVVQDVEAALPRRVEQEVPRMTGAPDIAPSVENFTPVMLPTHVAHESVPVATVDFAPQVALSNASIAGFGGTDKADGFGLGSVAAEEAARQVYQKENRVADVPLSFEMKSNVAEKVRLQVDEEVVKKAREDVRALRDEVPGAPFEENVKLTLAQWIDPMRPQRKYFRVRISSDATKPLPVVAKDVVYLLDASGSIADDRLKSCRNAIAEEIRRLNSNDRFNVVAFRDKFSYCFDGWQDVEAFTVRRADAWLSRLTAHGRTDVFATLRSVMAVPRAPNRPMIALVITDGEATSGLTRSAEIISRFSELNGGLVSIYMYGVKANANAYLMDMLARGNRGGWYRHEGIRWRAASGIPAFAAKFSDPVLADVAVTFAAASRCDVYPRMVTNLYRSEPIEIWGVCPSDQKDVIFSMRGLNGVKVYENVFRLEFDKAEVLDASAARAWATCKLYSLVSDYTRIQTPALLATLRDFASRYGLQVPYANMLDGRPK